MTKPRIRMLREARGLSQEQLALAIGRTKSVISRIESGETRLDLDVAQKIADTLNTTLADVLGIGPGSQGPRGFSEDVHPYVAIGPDDHFTRGLGPNEYLLTVDTNVCENAGIKRGDVVVVNDSAAAVAGVAPLDVVIVMYHHPETPNTATQLLRQFVPPNLLITNSDSDNARSINLAKEDAHIVSVFTGMRRRAKNGHG